jgi:hypothetical protein
MYDWKQDQQAKDILIVCLQKDDVYYNNSNKKETRGMYDMK